MEQKENTGVVFTNDKKGNEKAPDYKGSCNVNGVEKSVAMWLRKDKNGNDYFSMMFSDPYKKA